MPTPGSALADLFSPPYVVEGKVSETDYVISTPERRRKTRLCHVNMLKSFHPSDIVVVGISSLVAQPELEDDLMPCERHLCGTLANSEFLSTIYQQLLSLHFTNNVMRLLGRYPSILQNVLEHDIIVGDVL